MNIKHILVPTDLSLDSLRPCEPVAELAEAWGAQITLLHVRHVTSDRGFDIAMVHHDTPTEMAEQSSDARFLLEKHRALLGDRVACMVEDITASRVPEAVVKYAEEHDVDLIALSTHGHTGFRHMVMGSVAERVLRLSAVPVMVFPRER